MRTTIELPEDSERALHSLARRFHFTDEEALVVLIQVCLVGPEEIESVPPTAQSAFVAYVAERLGQGHPIRSTPGVLGGDARIRNTRIPVWLVVAHKKWGESDSEILAQYPSLNAADLVAAWDYYAANSDRVDSERQANEEAE